MTDERAPRQSLPDTVEELSKQLARLQQSHRRQGRSLVGLLLLMVAGVALGAAVKVKNSEFEVWPDAATADPKSSHQIKLIGTTGAAVQRSIVLQNKSIDGTSYRLDIRAGATDLLTLQSDGKVGVGTTGPGATLEVAGQLKITGGAPGVGKILTSDAAGLATWESLEGSPSTSANTNTLAADSDHSELDSKLFLEVDGAKRVTINGGGWDVETASLVASFNVTLEDSLPQGVALKPDGTGMYFVGGIGDNVYEYSLPTAWSVTGASLVRTFSVSTEETSPSDLFFKPDGTRMYIVGFSGDDVNEYSLSTAWNISTASFVRVFSVSTQETTPQAVFFKPDGTRMYVLGSVGDDVNEYSLSTAWNISTASFVQAFSVGTQETSPTGFSFKADGTKMFVVGLLGDDVNEYNLSKAWDVSTASFVQLFSVSAEETTPRGLFVKPGGTAMYVLGSSSDKVHQYSLGGSAPGYVGIGTTNPKYKLDVRGTIGNDTTEHHGADYAEWFKKDAGESLIPGDLIGLHPRSLRARKYQPGDQFIGVYSTFPGTVGNRDHNRSEAEMRQTHALVGLLGQLPFDRQQTVLDGCTVRTKDGKKVGLLLANGKVLIGR